MSKKVAVVTGGTGGIGTAICLDLYEKDYEVIATYNNGGNDDFATNWQEDWKAQGKNFHIAYCDVASFESCQGFVSSTLEKFDNISIVINNAGITRDSTLKKMTVEQWESVLRVNLDSVFNLSRCVIEHMLDNKYGRIINISSINAQKGQFGQCNYSAAKAGIHGFTKALAQECAKNGVTVNTISPGYVATPMVKKIDQAVLDKIVAGIPVGRLAEPSEIARIVSFLADEQAGFITGSNIAANGGQHMF